MADEEGIKSCEICGATIYPEHLSSGRAAVLKGQLLCPVCLNEKKSETTSTPLTVDGEPAVALIDETEMEKSGRKVIRAFGGVGGHKIDESQLQRALQKTGTGATRIKIFHTKMNDGAVDFLCQTVNEWTDKNPDIDIKLVQSTVGIWEGKHPEPHLILTIWY
jgi:hypothetical protein